MAAPASSTGRAVEVRGAASCRRRRIHPSQGRIWRLVVASSLGRLLGAFPTPGESDGAAAAHGVLLVACRVGAASTSSPDSCPAMLHTFLALLGCGLRVRPAGAGARVPARLVISG